MSVLRHTVETSGVRLTTVKRIVSEGKFSWNKYIVINNVITVIAMSIDN